MKAIRYFLMLISAGLLAQGNLFAEGAQSSAAKESPHTASASDGRREHDKKDNSSTDPKEASPREEKKAVNPKTQQNADGPAEKPISQHSTTATRKSSVATTRVPGTVQHGPTPAHTPQTKPSAKPSTMQSQNRIASPGTAASMHQSHLAAAGTAASALSTTKTSHYVVQPVKTTMARLPTLPVNTVRSATPGLASVGGPVKSGTGAINGTAISHKW
jgi:hypothetical protein